MTPDDDPPVIDDELLLLLENGNVVAEAMASKNSSRTNTLGKLFAVLNTATHTSSKSLTTRVGSNLRMASKSDGQDARNRSKLDEVGVEENALTYATKSGMKMKTSVNIPPIISSTGKQCHQQQK
jgi:hypothetical protein